jgi:hypothetical protein
MLGCRPRQAQQSPPVPCVVEGASAAERFNVSGPDWSATLEPHGSLQVRWQAGVRYWRRPGKEV